MASAEAQVGAALWQADMPDRFAIRGKDAHAVEFGRAHAPAAPQVSVNIDAKAIRGAGPGVNQYPAVAQRLAAFADLESADAARPGARLDHIQHFLVRRECQAIGPADIIGDDVKAAADRIDAVNALRQF